VIFLTSVLLGVLLCGGGGLWALFRVLPDDDADRADAVRVASGLPRRLAEAGRRRRLALLLDPKAKDPTEFAALLPRSACARTG
jgi:hypothetical protein